MTADTNIDVDDECVNNRFVRPDFFLDETNSIRYGVYNHNANTDRRENINNDLYFQMIEVVKCKNGYHKPIGVFRYLKNDSIYTTMCDRPLHNLNIIEEWGGDLNENFSTESFKCNEDLCLSVSADCWIDIDNNTKKPYADDCKEFYNKWLLYKRTKPKSIPIPKKPKEECYDSIKEYQKYKEYLNEM